MIYRGKNEEFLELKSLSQAQELIFDHKMDYPLVFLWTKNSKVTIKFEGNIIEIEPNTILPLTFFQSFEFVSLEYVRYVKFNKEFYCVLEHDKEVSCKGILFYNTNQLPYFTIPKDEIGRFEALWNVFETEMKSKDELQLEMLQMLLKRFIILSTRLYKQQNCFIALDTNETDTIREYNFLVEQHFKTKHTVAEYADLLHKSPKTLSNIFKKLSSKTPLQFIKDRRMLEARRLLTYTDKTVSEIGYELGFSDLQSFSRFFKNEEGISPIDFKS